MKQKKYIFQIKSRPKIIQFDHLKVDSPWDRNRNTVSLINPRKTKEEEHPNQHNFQKVQNPNPSCKNIKEKLYLPNCGSCVFSQKIYNLRMGSRFQKFLNSRNKPNFL